MNMIINCVVAACAIVLIFFTLTVKKKGDAEFGEYAEALDEKKFKMKKYLPIGLYLNSHISIMKLLPKMFYEPLYRYNNSVGGKVKELYGVKYFDFYYEIHNATKWLTAVLGALAMIAFAGINCINNEPKSAVICVVLSPVLALALSFLMDKDLDGKIDDRRTNIMIEFPEFINKLLLLVNAGMTISKAWEKIVEDNKKDTPLYEELNVSIAEIRAGKPEAVAYEEFARRCKIKEIIKFVSVIVLNLKKGGSEVVPTLRAQSDECWEMRKATAKRLGEKASSKLMLPMAIMLVGIILIVALPAVLALTGM